MPEPPTAVLAGSDMQAMGILDAARRRGLRIPEDFSVVGYGDVELAQYLGLTTIQVPMRELGRLGMERLLAAQEQMVLAAATDYLAAKLVVRRTCGPPP